MSPAITHERRRSRIVTQKQQLEYNLAFKAFLTNTVMLLFAWNNSFAQISNDDDGADPSPTVSHYVSERSRGSSKTTIPPLPLPIETVIIKKELYGYQSGRAVHEESDALCVKVAKQVEELTKRGERKIDRIVVTGFADGIPNPGLDERKIDWKLVPTKCRRGITFPVDDPHLALLSTSSR